MTKIKDRMLLVFFVSGLVGLTNFAFGEEETCPQKAARCNISCMDMYCKTKPRRDPDGTEHSYEDCNTKKLWSCQDVCEWWMHSKCVPK